MKLNEWVSTIKKYGGIDYDGVYGRQCVDLVNHYASKVLGISGCFYGLNYAYEIYTKYPSLPKINKNFKRIDVNARGEYPQRGDVIVWSKAKNGYAGHTAVCLSGDKNGFTVFEQNYNGRGGIREYRYSYRQVSGWLRPYNQNNIKEEVKKVSRYGNATMKSAQSVYSDSLLKNKIGSVGNGEGVYFEGSGSGNDIVIYQCGSYYKAGFVKGGTVKKN